MVACAGDLSRPLWLIRPSARAPALTVRLAFCPRPRSARWPRSSLGSRVIGESGSPHSQHQQSQRGTSESSLEPLKPGVLTASANPFGATALVHRSVTRVRRSHHSNSGRPRSHRAGTPTSTPVHTTVNHRVVAAKYTPARHTSASVGVTPETQSSSATGSTPPATPVAPTHSTSSSNSGSGSSSGSASPSQSKRSARWSQEPVPVAANKPTYIRRPKEGRNT